MTPHMPYTIESPVPSMGYFFFDLLFWGSHRPPQTLQAATTVLVTL